MLVHPALLAHPAPRRVFIAGGGEGATAREVLRHPAVEAVTMVDIDAVVCDFCERHLPANAAAFADPRLTLVVDDAAAQLRAAPDGAYDVIVGDLADPVAGGPCFQLYTREFYEGVVAKKLAPGGIFVTQSGPAGVLSAGEVFAPIHHTLAAVFPRVEPLTAHVPSYADTWGWNVAFAAGVAGGGGGGGGEGGEAGTGAAAAAPPSALPESAAAADAAIAARIQGDLTVREVGEMERERESVQEGRARRRPRSPPDPLCPSNPIPPPPHVSLPLSLPPSLPSFPFIKFLDGATLLGARALNKVVRGVLATETHVYTVASPRFIHGEGLGK
jgi:hypothetical protein